MPFENIQADKRRIAIIGGGVSGLGAAYALRRSENVILFEAGVKLGGHARTVLAGKNGNRPVDTGFLVYNNVNYPHLTKLFDELAVPTIPSDMSFGASIDGGWLEYGILAPKAIIAQKRNIFRPKFLGMMRDILKFNKLANKSLIDSNITIGNLIKDWGLGDWFRDYYLTPFTGAIWSTPITKILDFPALPMIKFMKNHALLGTGSQHDWRTVNGGSCEYVHRVENKLRESGVEIRLSTAVTSVRRVDSGVEVKAAGGIYEYFDEVIFATHSDITLGMLSDPTEIERSSLNSIKYQSNKMVLHADTSIMPKRKAAWASWVYTEEKNRKSDHIDLTYWINRLQSLPEDDPCFVTLNTQRPIKPNLIYDECVFYHPVFDLAALQGQRILADSNGANSTWFCGAWMRNGFHEDGLATGMEVARGILDQSSSMIAAE
ncbi:FAD-dependent oxidoreductase [Planktomarina sp.]|nr:FAD-dependent oxidoreductase [Planktomarina sp.]